MPETPIFEKKERLESGGGVQPFGEAAGAGAAATNIASDIGSKMAISAATQRAELHGMELGKSPQGDIFPSFTASDKAFETAYRNQAQATLSLQGQDLINNSLAVVNGAGKLTPEIIQEFEANSKLGLAEIAKNSPSADQAKLMNSFDATLSDLSGKLQMNLLKQAKAEAQDNNSAYLSLTSQNMFESAANGRTEDSNADKQNVDDTINSMFESGQISGSERDSKLQQAKISHLTGVEYNKALKAKADGNLTQYLSDLGKNKIEGTTTLEQLQIAGAVLDLIKKAEATDAMNQSALVAEANAALAPGGEGATPENIDKWRREMSEPNFFATNLTISKNIAKQEAKDEKMQNVLDNKNNVLGGSLFTDKEKNESYETRVKKFVKEGAPELESRMVVANDTAYPISAHTDIVNDKSASQNPLDVDDSIRMLDALTQSNPALANGITQQARLKQQAYTNNLGKGMSPSAAAIKAQDSVYNISDAEQSLSKDLWGAHEADVFGIFQGGSRGDRERSVVKGARELMNIGKDSLIDDELAWSYSVLADYKDAWFKSTRDHDVATNVTKKKYSEGFIPFSGNNLPGSKKKPVLQRFPYTMALDIPEGFNYIVEDDIGETVENLVKDFNNDEQAPFRYDIVRPGIVSYGEMIAAKDRVSELEKIRRNPTLNRKDRLDAKIEQARENKVILDYTNPENGRPYTNKIDKESGENLGKFYFGTSYTEKTSTLDGSPEYEITLIDENGKMLPFQNIFSSGNQAPVWRANNTKINNKLAKEVSETGVVGARKNIAQASSQIKSEEEQKAISDAGKKEAVVSRQAEIDERSARDAEIDARTDLNEGQKQDEKDRQDISESLDKIGTAALESVLEAREISLKHISIEGLINFVDRGGRAVDSALSPVIKGFVKASKNFITAISGSNQAEIAESRKAFRIAREKAEAESESEVEPVSLDTPQEDLRPTGEVLESTGKEILVNSDGTISTELSITVEDMKLNDGKPTNIPSIWNGEQLTDEGSIEAAINSGENYPSFGSIPAAEKAAQERSDKLGEEAQKQLEPEIEDAEDIQELPPSEASRASTVARNIRKVSDIVGFNPVDLIIIGQVESTLNPDAENKASSAKGTFQLLDGSFKDYVNRFGKKLGVKMSDRGNDEKEMLLAAKNLKVNKRILTKNLGRVPTLAELYTTHFLGLRGGERFIRAVKNTPNAKTIKVAGADAVSSNKELLQGTTVRQAMDRINKKIATGTRDVKGL